MLIPAVILVPQSIGAGYLFMKKTLFSLDVIGNYGYHEAFILVITGLLVYFMLIWNVGTGLPGLLVKVTGPLADQKEAAKKKKYNGKNKETDTEWTSISDSR